MTAYFIICLFIYFFGNIASVYHVQDFKELYDIFGSWSPSEKDVQDFPSKVIIWPSIYSDSLRCQYTL